MPLLARSHRWKLRSFLGFICILALLYLGLTALRHLFPLEYRETILEQSAAYDLDPAWVASIVRFESRFQPEAVSRAGAIGLMQIMPETALWIIEQQTPPLTVPANLKNPTTNVHLGAWYLRHLLDRFEDRNAALMAYNAGPSNAEEWKGNLKLAFPETQEYVRHIHMALPIYRVYFNLPWLIDLVPSVHF